MRVPRVGRMKPANLPVSATTPADEPAAQRAAHLRRSWPNLASPALPAPILDAGSAEGCSRQLPLWGELLLLPAGATVASQIRALLS